MNSFENVILKSIEINQISSHLSSLFLIHYSAQFLLIENGNLDDFCSSQTNNEFFLKNVFLPFWRISIKPFVKTETKKRKRTYEQYKFIRNGLENSGSKFLLMNNVFYFCVFWLLLFFFFVLWFSCQFFFMYYFFFDIFSRNLFQ